MRYTYDMKLEKSYKLSKEELFKIHQEVTANFCKWVRACDDIPKARKPEIMRNKMKELEAFI